MRLSTTKLIYSILLVLSVLLCTTSSAMATDIALRLKSGKSFVGEVTLHKEEKQVSIVLKDKSMAFFSFGDVEVKSLYKILKRDTNKSDMAERMDLAVFARDNMLYRYAIEGLQVIIDADTELKTTALIMLQKIVPLHQAELSQSLDELIVDDGATKKLKKMLRDILRWYPGSELALRAKKLSDDLAKKVAKADADADAGRAAAPKYTRQQQKHLDHAKTLWKLVREQDALASSLHKSALEKENKKFNVRAQVDYDAVVVCYGKAKNALKKIENLCNKYEYVKDEYYNNKVQNYRVHSERRALLRLEINILVQSSTLYLRDDMFIEARAKCNEVFMLDSDNKEASKLRLMISKEESEKNAQLPGGD